MKLHALRDRLACAAVACLSAAPFGTSAAPPELDPVTVTGSRTPRTLGSEIAATSVLTRADIERSGARDAVEVLDLLGTSIVEQQGGPGTLASIRLRGADTRDTLVLIDGVPLTDVTSGQALVQQIPAEMIERVEVVRGNLSALYGANATGGVVQIFTRRAEAGAMAASLAAGLGSRATRSLDASVASGGDALRWRLGAGIERTRGFSAIDPALAPNANPDDDGNRRSHLALALDGQWSEGQRIAFDLRHVDGRVQYDDGSTFATPTDTHEQHLIQDGLSLHGEHALPLALPWTFAWRLHQNDETRHDDAGGFSFGNAVHDRGLAFDLQGQPLPGWRLQAGLDRRLQSTDSTSYLRNARGTSSVRAGASYDAGWGGVQANLRNDRTSDFGSATTGLIGARLVLADGLSAIGSVSNSFTPPTLDALFFDCSAFKFVCSNPDLRPERAGNAEVGLQWQTPSLLLRATVFSVRYRDKIANDDRGVPQNVARAKNQGLELSVRAARGPWVLIGELTAQHPVDEATGERLVRRPREQLAVRADYQAGAWSAGAGVRYVGDRPDFFNRSAVTLASYSVVDASARRQLAPGWSLEASLENLFDRAYQPVAGYNGVPRGLFVKLLWQPGAR